MRIYKIAISKDNLYDMIREEQYNIMQEYYSDSRVKGQKMSWSVIPFARLKKIWEDYARDGIVKDESGMNEIVEKMIKILVRLHASNDLSGHGNGVDYEDELGVEDPGSRNADFYFDFLNTEYGEPCSDYGLDKLWKIAFNLIKTTNAEQQLLLVDQMLNVVHQRGDLSALFVEGGISSLNTLSSNQEKEKDVDIFKDDYVQKNYAFSNLNWYKTAKQVEHSYSWVYIELPKDICDAMKEFSKEIDPDDLFEGEGDGGLETDFHVTVKYGLLTEDVKDIKECLDGLKGGKVHLGSSSIFEGEKYDVVKITVESESLNKLHENLNSLPHEDKHMEYHAHATIAYVKKGKGKKYKSKFKLNKGFKFDKVFFGNNEKDFGIKLSSCNLFTNWHKMAEFTEFVEDTGVFSAWIFPDGEIVDIANLTHSEYIRTYPQRFSFKQKDLVDDLGHEISTPAIYDKVFNKNIVRFIRNASYLFIEGKMEAIRNINSIIHSLAKSFMVKKIIVKTIESQTDKFLDIEEIYNL